MTNALSLHSSKTWAGRMEAYLLQFSGFSVPSGFENSCLFTRARDLQRSRRVCLHYVHSENGSAAGRVSLEDGTYHQELGSWAVARVARKTATRSLERRTILSGFCKTLLPVDLFRRVLPAVSWLHLLLYL